MENTAPLRPADAHARETARRMLAAMRHATLAVIDPGSGHPHLSRILCQAGADGGPVALLSALAAHSRSLAADPRAGLMIDAPQDKGDPMTWPRLALQVTARPLPDGAPLRAGWQDRHPPSRLFLGLPDFTFWQLVPRSGFLNAGFGAAFHLAAADLLAP
ncbi:pyridoxamine 5'-phosphate oxidase family protein [Paracoccus spongiarum]|uniref:Pyridoxamine 5'-phosphate oxidase family protein n=1 Tax=Paracoccus spongiarum TaxID=3064387 RepID=A0ABT9JBR4_9RHOB|nr:pyridoxamine 5'-phosphate oxidase family protein [Paracoccus sp. 2205BS29-5]MDP5307214.1 pyridoxamine 5'-phosphate oxidase family protein [Paracoccus sp. 2205BS29-5]